jgi:hypothetical protein
MSTSLTIANMPTPATDVTIGLLDQSKLKLRSSDKSEDGLTYVADYVYAFGDVTTETNVVVRVNVQPTKNIVQYSIRLRSVQILEVDSVIVETAPIEVFLAWNTPGRYEDTTPILNMIGTAFSLAFDGVTLKVPNEGILDAMNRSLVHDLYG